MIRLARFVVPPAILLAVIVIATVRGEAHKPITSPYTRPQTSSLPPTSKPEISTR
jgi:hypothetical protein